MKRLDKFILKAFLGPFIAILLVVIFILMMQFLWLYIDELVGKGLGLRVILEFLFWGVCTILPLALPLSTLLSSMMVVGSMGENNELMAIKASGISLARVMQPLSIAALVISVIAFFAGNYLVPTAYNEIFTLRDDIGRTKSEIKIPSGTFYEGIDGYVLRVDDQNDRGMMYGVMVYDHTGQKGNTSVTIADSSTIRMSRNKDYLVFTLYSGTNYQETNEIHYRDSSFQLQRISFARQELFVPLENYSFEHSDSSRFGDQAKSMNLGQLVRQRDTLSSKLDGSYRRHVELMRKSIYLQKSSQLDSAMANSGRTVFSDPDFLKWKKIEVHEQALRDASEKASFLRGELESYTRDTFESDFYMRHTLIEYFKKFAQALACFILFFIGAPLGALIKKGGLGTSAIVSVLFFVLYWVVDISGTKLARDGAVAASAGVFISSLVLTPIGIFLTWKAINDKTVMNINEIKTKFRQLAARIRQWLRPTRIVFMGTPDFAVASLDALVKGGYKVVGVVTVADKPSGRGLQVNRSAVKKYADGHGIPVLQPLKLKDPEFLSALSAWKADLFVVVAFRMLPEEVWKMPPLGTFNLHAALLPQYRGAAPINWAVINGEKITGVTTFMIDKDIDTGGIIFREECRISPDETAGDVHDHLMSIGAELVVNTVDAIIQHNVETRVQRSFIQGSEVLKPAPKLTRETCRIDWKGKSGDIRNLIRGLSPYPAAFTTFVRGEEELNVKIYYAESSDLKVESGRILSDGRTYLVIGCADGALAVTDLQMAGKKRMDVKAFLAGFRNPEEYTAV